MSVKIKIPDDRGYFGNYGGAFIPEIIMPAVIQLQEAYKKLKNDPSFKKELRHYLKDYVGRPTPLYKAERLGETLGLKKLYLKREDLCHSGAHKINNALGQGLLALYMGKKRVIAETGAGQHGVAVATVAALFGLKCSIFMGAEDVARQAPNVHRMKLLGAELIPVESGNRTLKEAINEAMREWITAVDTTHYIIGSVVGPHPFPQMVRDFQSVIGKEVKSQILAKEKVLPRHIVACVGGGSNAMGIFYPFARDNEVNLIGVEAGGTGNAPGEHSSTLQLGFPGVFHGTLSYLLQDSNGQILPVHSVSAGLDYPGVGPEHSYLKDSRRAEYFSVSDEEALESFHLLSCREGILPALESSHALAYLPYLAKKIKKAGRDDDVVVVNLSGRGDKDLGIVRGVQNDVS